MHTIHTTIWVSNVKTIKNLLYHDQDHENFKGNLFTYSSALWFNIGI